MKSVAMKTATAQTAKMLRVLRPVASAESSRGLRAEVARLEMLLRVQTERVRALEAAASTCTLTGLLNRRGLDAALAAVVADHTRYGHTAAVALLDLNKFKPINDTHGHAAGDAVLRHVATLLRGHVRTSDVVARVGGDEFVVILRTVDVAAAQAKMAVLTSLIAKTPCVWRGEKLWVGAACGVAGTAEAGTAEDLVGLADARMYMHKGGTKGSQGGR